MAKARRDASRRVRERLYLAAIAERGDGQFLDQIGDGHRFGDPVRAAIAGAAEHGVGYKAQASVLAYESARLAALAFAGRGPDSSDVAVICQNGPKPSITWPVG